MPKTVWFKREYHRERYGDTAVVTDVSVAISRPFGTKTTLVDMTTANGTKLQWYAATVKRDTKEMK